MYYDKITKEDMFNKILTLLPKEKDVVEFCNAELETMRGKADRAKERAEERRCDKDELSNIIYNVLKESEVQLSIAEIVWHASTCTSELVTTGKVAYRVNAMCRNGLIKKDDLKVFGKKNPIKVYYV